MTEARPASDPFPHALVDGVLEVCAILVRGVKGEARKNLVSCVRRLIAACEVGGAADLLELLDATAVALTAAAVSYTCAARLVDRPDEDETVRQWARNAAEKLARYARGARRREAVAG